MWVILRELRRRPGRFLPVGGAMTMLVVLLMVMGGFLDGLEREGTGAFRSQDDRLWVLAADAELQLGRSRIDRATAAAVADVDGVAAVGGITSLSTTAAMTGFQRAGASAEPTGVGVFGYELASSVLPEPPAAGEVVADRRLAELLGAEVGDELEVGPTAERLRIAAFADDVTQNAPTLWLGQAEWRALATVAAPATLPPEGVVHAVVIEPTDPERSDELAARVDAATGTTQTVDLDTLLDGQPVVAQQSAAFQGIIATTFVVVLLVVALFFALLILERLRLYAVLKALGARSGDLAAGVVAQAVVIALTAFVLGAGLAVALIGVLPDDLPLQLLPQRVVQILAGTVVTAVLGVLLVLRRILRIEPAQSIG